MLNLSFSLDYLAWFLPTFPTHMGASETTVTLPRIMETISKGVLFIMSPLFKMLYSRSI